MNNEYSDVHVRSQLSASRSLLKFCEEHNYKSKWLENLRQCIKSLETGHIASAVESYRAVPLGGNGCFNDWWPPVVYENETEEYISSVFEALVGQWARLVALSTPKKALTWHSRGTR